MFFFFNDTATTEIYTLSLHDALPILISPGQALREVVAIPENLDVGELDLADTELLIQGVAASAGSYAQSQLRYLLYRAFRSEEHTSELQSRPHLVCRLLLGKKKRASI